MAGRRNFLYSRYYLGVNCDECLENRPLTKSVWDTTSPALKAATLVFLVVMSPLLAWGALMYLKDGQILIGLTMAAVSALVLLPFLEGHLEKIVLKTAKPLATKILAKPFRGVRR